MSHFSRHDMQARAELDDQIYNFTSLEKQALKASVPDIELRKREMSRALGA